MFTSINLVLVITKIILSNFKTRYRRINRLWRNKRGWVFIIYWLTRDHTSGTHDDIVAVVFTSINLHHTIDAIGLANFKNQIGQTGQILFIPDHIMSMLLVLPKGEVFQCFLTINSNGHHHIMFSFPTRRSADLKIILSNFKTRYRRINRLWRNKRGWVFIIYW